MLPSETFLQDEKNKDSKMEQNNTPSLFMKREQLGTGTWW